MTQGSAVPPEEQPTLGPDDPGAPRPPAPPRTEERSPFGRTFAGRYVVRAKLGQGGMGVVYLADDRSLRREVALKVLPDDSRKADDRRRRLLREARAAARLNHPNIAAVYDVGEDGGDVFLAMEYVPGRSLRARMDDGDLGAEEALRLARAIASGLGAAHQAGVVHRDVKPENVLLGQGGSVKVVDFGLAKSLGDPDASSSLASRSAELRTADGVVLGTPAYMSPEQARGEPVGPPSDVFSLGVVLHEMLAGERPFQGRTPPEAIHAVLSRPAPPLPSAPPRLAALVTRCLEKQPAARFPTATALLEALSAPDLLAPPGKPLARRLALAALAVAAAGAAAASIRKCSR